MNPIFLKLGNLEIRYYGLMYALAFVTGLFIARYEARRKGLDLKLIEDYSFVVMLSGLLGGRLYYVLLNGKYYFGNPTEIFAVWHGGMAIHGGIIGGIIATVIFAKIKKINVMELGDIAAAPFILGQAIGRVGNLMNGDAHGVPVFTPLKVMIDNTFSTWWPQYMNGQFQNLPDLVPWGIVFPLGTPAGNQFPNTATHPVMVYEMLLNFIAFFSIWFIFRKIKVMKHSLFLVYLIEYGVIRAVVTIFRADDLMINGVIRAPHVVSLVMIIVSAAMMLKTVEKNKKLQK